MTIKTTAIILAGGAGNRFKSKDKGLIQWHNKALIDHVIEPIEPQVDTIIISCNRNIKDYQARGFLCIEDPLDNFQGPLAGIQASLTACKTNRALIIGYYP